MGTEKIRKYVESVFRKNDMDYCGTVWFYKYHILPVYKNAKMLARKYEADEKEEIKKIL